MNSLRKGSNLPLEEEVEQLRKQLEESQRKLTITQEEMKKAGATSALVHTKLRSWKGVDWTVPAYSMRLILDDDTPARGKISVTDKGTLYELVFDDGWTVTNNLECARKIAENTKKQYSIKEVKQ